ncbi:MAG TPA: hypothetical protein VII06_35205 [Chloroflexota bacterium]|jgi:hypothetical protein
MMEARVTYVFIVRLWNEPRQFANAPPEWRGSIQDVTSQKPVYFRRFDRMTRFIAEQTGAWPMEASPVTRCRRFLDRLRGWC